MKHFYRISWDIDTTPTHLFKSLLLSLYVMTFINVFIGSMGGIPAFVGFMAVFYLLRGMVLAGNRIGHQLALESKTEVKHMLTNYLVIYLVIWLIMKLILMLSKITGWGNINDLSFVEYIRSLYGTTMLEKWAYLFTGILMFSFVLSLFPLILIRKRQHWIRYFMVDSLLYAAICVIISQISLKFVAKELRKKAVCVLDVMLLTRLPQRWEAAMYIVVILIFTVTMGGLIYNYGVRTFAPRKGTKDISKALLNIPAKDNKKRYRAIAIRSVCVMAIMLVAALYFFFAPVRKEKKYKKVAECLTEDSILGPIAYNNELYIPVDKTINYSTSGKALGYLAHKSEDCSSRFYQLAVNNIIYSAKKDMTMEHLQLDGAETNVYQKINSVEELNQWKFDNVFLLWDEDWSGESAYSKDLTGYSECERELIASLESTFGTVDYNPSDFEKYDACFTIRAYSDMQEVIEAEIPYGDWVGCILVKDNNFYYGNFENRITGVQLSTLLEVLGGN